MLGLGNPGREYDSTRHNVGFAVIERLARRFYIDLSRARHKARFGRGRIRSRSVILAQPLTYMNLSGEAAKPLMKFHGIEPDRLIVVHDETDLEEGAVRIKFGGGTAGHNGLKSLVRHLGTKDYTRIRMGIGRPPHGMDLSRYVLMRPSRADAAALDDLTDLASDAVEEVLEHGLEAAMGRFNRRQPT